MRGLGLDIAVVRVCIGVVGPDWCSSEDSMGRAAGVVEEEDDDDDILREKLYSSTTLDDNFVGNNLVVSASPFRTLVDDCCNVPDSHCLVARSRRFN